MIPPFGPVKAHALSEEQRAFVATQFGTGILPPDSTVEVKSNYLIIEQFDLARFLDDNPAIALIYDPRLCAEGKLHFPFDSE